MVIITIITFFILALSISFKEIDKNKKREIFERALRISVFIDIYKKNKNFKYGKEMEFSLLEEMKSFDVSLSRHWDKDFANRMRTGMRLLINRGGVPCRNLIAKA